MAAAKLFTSGTLSAMKSDEGNDSLDSFIRQAMGKEPLLPYPRSVDSPAQWIQLLHALDQPDLPGWPFLTPVKVQMQKCEKCLREFCSPINYKRHIRVHRRSLVINKEWHKNRNLLAAFWDKLLLEQAREIVSFNGVLLKEIPGSTILRALASLLHRPGAWTLPQAYVKAGAALLDIVQAEPSGLLVSSHQLFSILDDASERTFLCAGTAESVQKYIFDGETAKSCLELKNLVALTSFLFEQQLVKAWVFVKDAEALRCHKLLVEEEEAAQKRQALLLEKKKQKKLRQKEQKVREQYYGCNGDLNDAIDRPTSAEASNSISNTEYVPATLGSIEPQDKESDEDIEPQFGFSSEHMKRGDSPAIELQMVGANCHKSQRVRRYGLHANSNLSPSKDRSQQSGNKVWTKKHKSNKDGEKARPPSLQEVPSLQIEPNNSEVVIGSITIVVALRNETRDTFTSEHKKKNASEKSNSLQSGSNRVAPCKHWRPISRGETKNADRRNEDRDNGAISSEAYDNNGCHNGQQFHVERGFMPFSKEAAKEFLARRWKDAISGDHVVLKLSSGHDPPRSNLPNQFGRAIQIHVARKADKSVKSIYKPKQKGAA